MYSFHVCINYLYVHYLFIYLFIHLMSLLTISLVSLLLSTYVYIHLDTHCVQKKHIRQVATPLVTGHPSFTVPEPAASLSVARTSFVSLVLSAGH